MGRLFICVSQFQTLSDNLDNIEVPLRTAEFDTLCGPLSTDYLKSVLPKRSIVLASVGEQFNSISTICRQINVPCVYVTEYNLRTRHQIIAEYQREPRFMARGVSCDKPNRRSRSVKR